MNRMPGPFCAALGLGLLSTLSGCATDRDGQPDKMQRSFEHAAETLSKSADADSLAAAALLSSLNGIDTSLSLIARATDAAPERPDLLWLRIRFCQTAPDCDAAPFEQRLQALEGANGAAWLGALVRAGQTEDEDAKNRALAAIGLSERVDFYWTTLIARLSRAIAGTRAVSLSEAGIHVVGLLAAQAIPAFKPTADACKGERLQRSAILESCRGVAKALEAGDTIITELMGVGIAKRVWPEDSPEWATADEARRVYEYRSKLSAGFETWLTRHQGLYFELCAKHRREQDVSREVLLSRGRPPDPPSDQLRHARE